MTLSVVDRTRLVGFVLGMLGAAAAAHPAAAQQAYMSVFAGADYCGAYCPDFPNKTYQAQDREVCGEGVTPCPVPFLVADTGAYERNASERIHGSAKADLASAQVKAFVYSPNIDGHGSDAYANLRDFVTLTLEPNSTAVITFRAIIRGDVDPTYEAVIGRGSGFSVRFGPINESIKIDSGHSSAFYEETFTITNGHPSNPSSWTYEASAGLQLSTIYNYSYTLGGAILDYSSGAGHGIRLEVDLPPGVVMTSTSGLFLTEPPKPSACNNGLDDDEDGFLDDDDPGCFFGAPERYGVCWPDPFSYPIRWPLGCDRDGDTEIPLADTSEQRPDIACDDGLDNDSDGYADWSPWPLGWKYSGDPGCYRHVAKAGPSWVARKAWLDTLGQPENPACDDGLDNDGDGGIDWGNIPGQAPDSYCVEPWRMSEKPPPEFPNEDCGLGFELVFLAPLLTRLSRLRRRA